MKVEYDSETADPRALRLNGDRVTLDDHPGKALAVFGGGLLVVSVLALLGALAAVGVTYSLGFSAASYLLAGVVGLCLGVVLPFLALAASKRLLV